MRQLFCCSFSYLQQVSSTFNIIIHRKLLYYFIPALAQTTINEDDMVQCFNNVTSCNANSNVIMITAGQCCNSTGGPSRHVRVFFLDIGAFFVAIVLVSLLLV